VTDTRVRGPNCLSAEMLAAYVDGRLGADERTTVEAHLAECELCREAAVEAGSLAAELAAAEHRPTLAAVTNKTAPRRTWWYGVGAVAAVLIAVVWLRPWVTNGQRLDAAMGELVQAVGTNRFIEARLSGPFAYGRAPGVVRGPSDRPPPTSSVLAAASRVQNTDAGTSDARHLHARGIASLALGDIDAAVRALDTAARIGADGSVESDLAAALLERYRMTGKRDDAELALTHARRALAADAKSPAARYNLALAQTAVEGPDRSLDAWRAYLAIDSTSPWADEARAKLIGR